MTYVDELTAKLDIAGLAEFTRGMAVADASVGALRKNIAGLTADLVALRAALAGMKDTLVAARALSGDIGATDGSIAKNRANLALLEKERDVLAEIKALSGVTAAVAVGGGGGGGSSVNVGSLASNRYGLLGALLGPQAAQTIANQMRTQAQRDASSGGLEGMLLGAAQAQDTERAVKGAVTGQGSSNYGVLDYVEQANAAQLRNVYNSSVRSQFLAAEAARRDAAAAAAAAAPVGGADSWLIAQAASNRNAAQLLRTRMQNQFFQPGETVPAFASGLPEPERTAAGAFILGAAARRLGPFGGGGVAGLPGGFGFETAPGMFGLSGGTSGAKSFLDAGIFGWLLRGGGGGGGGGIRSALGWGGGGGIPVPWWLGGRFLGGRIGGGMAAFGSLAGLAGFGAERLVTSALGIGGSIAGAGLGGGLLAGGLASTAAVGMGTDLAGIGQAAGDIRNVTTAMSNLSTAIQTYGKNSQQAADAQAQLNEQLRSFSPVARGAVTAASQAALSFKSLFDQVTGPAEKIGAQIIQQAIQTGKAFLPTIGKYAAQNMGIIQQQLQPFFAWLKNAGPSGGLGVFTQLEQIFQANLPAGVHALTQGLELFTKTMGVAAAQSGGLVQTINRLLTEANSPSGFSRWSDEVVKLIGLFRTWADLGVSIVKVVYNIFSPAVGFGAGFAQTLTQIFSQIDGWLKQPEIQSLLHGLFTVHFTEVIKGIGGIFQALLPVLEAAAADFLRLSIVATGLVNAVLLPLAAVLRAITKIPFATDVLGFVAALLLMRNALAGVIAIGRGVLVSLGLIDAAVVTTGTEATASAGAVGFLRDALLGLGAPEVLAAIAAAYGAYKVFEGDPTAGDAFVKGNPYVEGSQNFTAFQAGMAGIRAVNGQVQVGPGVSFPDTNPAYLRGLRASGHPTNAVALMAGLLQKGNLQSINLSNIQFPLHLREQMAALSARGDITQANHLAYGYLHQYLAVPGLTGQQRYEINQQLAQYATAPIPHTGATPGGGTVPTIYQLPSRFAGPIAQAQLAAALGRPGAVAREIATTKAGLNAALAAAKSFPPNSANQLAALSEATSLAQQLSGLTGTGAGTTGASFLSPGLQARLTAAQNATAGITAQTAPTSTTIRAMRGLFEQLNAAVQQVTKSLNDNAYAGKQLTAAQAEQAALIKQRAAAQAALETARGNLSVERILGIAGTGSQTGRTAAAAAGSNLRTFLNGILKQFGLAETGSSPLGPFITELYKSGDINKRQYESLEKILHSIDDMKKITGTVAAGITGNISQRLQEIKDELATQTGFTLAGAQHSLSGILRASGARLAGSARARSQFLELGQYAVAHHGEVLSNAGAALGVPLTRHGSPSFSRHVVEVRVSGSTPIDKAGAALIAGEVHKILRRKTGRNSVQMTGSNAGVNSGF